MLRLWLETQGTVCLVPNPPQGEKRRNASGPGPLGPAKMERLYELIAEKVIQCLPECQGITEIRGGRVVRYYKAYDDKASCNFELLLDCVLVLLLHGVGNVIERLMKEACNEVTVSEYVHASMACIVGQAYPCMAMCYLVIFVIYHG